MVICYYSSPRKLTPQVPYGHPSTLCDGAFKSQQTQWGFTCMSCAAWCLAPTAGPAGFQGSLCTCSPWRRQTEFTASSHPCPFPAPELLSRGADVSPLLTLLLREQQVQHVEVRMEYRAKEADIRQFPASFWTLKVPSPVYPHLPCCLRARGFWNNFTQCTGNKGETKCLAWEQPIWRSQGKA